MAYCFSSCVSHRSWQNTLNVVVTHESHVLDGQALTFVSCGASGSLLLQLGQVLLFHGIFLSLLSENWAVYSFLNLFFLLSVGFYFPVLKIVSVQIQGLVTLQTCGIFMLYIWLLWDCYLGVFNCPPVVRKFMFRFFSFPGMFFCLLCRTVCQTLKHSSLCIYSGGLLSCGHYFCEQQISKAVVSLDERRLTV